MSDPVYAEPRFTSEHSHLASESMHDNTNNFAPTNQHQCRHRHDYKGVWNKLTAWWLLPVHLLWSGFVAATFWYLSGKAFRIGDRHRSDLFTHAIYQAEIVTFVSSLLIITKLFAGAWQILCAWRCIFILLEKTGLRLKNIDQIASRTLFFPFGRKSAGNGLWQTLCAFILLLTWPAQLSNPIAAGSINWVPDTEFQTGVNFTATVGLANFATTNWEHFLNYTDVRQIMVKNAAGRAAMALNLTNVVANRPPPTAQLIAPAFEFIDGSLLQGVTAPAMSISDIAWVTGDLPTEIEMALLDPWSGFLNISSSESPLFLGGLRGNAAILKDTPAANDLINHGLSGWDGTLYAALLVDWIPNEPNATCQSIFADEGARIFDITYGDFLNCFQVAEMTVTAGVSGCATIRTVDGPSCEIVSPEVASLDPGMFSEMPIQQDPLFSTAFAMMPEVMQTLVALAGPDTVEGHFFANITQSPQAYLENVMAAAYYGAWSAMSQFLTYESEVTTSYWAPRPVVVADVTLWRVVLWLLLNFMLTISGVLLFVLQCLCHREPLANKIIPAFFLDTTSLLQHDIKGLSCGATKLNKTDLSLPPLRLSRSRRGADGVCHDELAFEWPPSSEGPEMRHSGGRDGEKTAGRGYGFGFGGGNDMKKTAAVRMSEASVVGE